MNGQVNARGQVSVTVSAGGQSASGTGRLSRDYGTGTWIGRSASDRAAPAIGKPSAASAAVAISG